MKKTLALVMSLTLLLTLFAGCSGNNNNAGSNSDNNSGSNSDDEFKQAYEEALGSFAEEDYDASISFKTLETNPDSYARKLLKYTGKISKIEATSDSNAKVYHISVENSSNKMIWAQTSAAGKSIVDDVTEGDTVNMYGIMYGMHLFTPVIYVVKIEKTGEVKGTKSNPFKIGETATFNGMETIFDDFKIELTVIEVIRGDEATAMFSNDPDEGEEFYLVKFKVKAIESKDDKAIRLNNAMFDIVNKDGVTYGALVSATGIKKFDEIYAGAETEGFVYQIINAGDEPLIVFLTRNNNGIWFSTAE